MLEKMFIGLLFLVVFVQGFFLLRSNVINYPIVSLQDGVYVVEVVDDQMEDDSVRAVKYRLELLADEFGQWYIDEQSSMWACWPGRGHKEFSRELCE